MSKSIHLVLAAAAIIASAGSAWAADEPTVSTPAIHHAATAKGAKAAPTDQELIASAMKAAPKNVADNATIVAPDPKGGMRTLRKGTNGFTCMPDNPETPGPDPMCWDKNAGDWIDAYLNHKAPPQEKSDLCTCWPVALTPAIQTRTLQNRLPPTTGSRPAPTS